MGGRASLEIMENLPKTLLALVNIVSEQYSEFSWSSVEQNGKMRISLTWTNNQPKRHKSKSTRSRDQRRYDEFIAAKNSVGENIKDQTLSSDTGSSDDDSESSDKQSDWDMEISVADKLEKTPCGSSRKVIKSPVEPNKEKQSSKKGSGGQSITDNACIKKTIHKPVEPPRQDLSRSKVNTGTQKRKTDNTQPIVQIPLSLDKIVIKFCTGSIGVLLAFLPGTMNILHHCLTDDETIIIDRSVHHWKYFKKNIEEDFNDVRQTKFYSDIVKEGIQKMEYFLKSQ